jgi:hypothetical protein
MMTGIALLFAFLAMTLACALHRAATDWPYRLRLIRVFDMLESRESPLRPFDLVEVVLVDPSPAHSACSIVFARTDRRDDVGELVLDRPLGERADLCSTWSAAGTPLLYAADWSGGAVLQGPVDCFIGHSVSWPISIPEGTS